MHKTIVVVFIIGLIYLGQSCSKDDAALLNNTVYTYNIPNGVLPSIYDRIPKDNITTKEGAALGRLLFYDPILSADNTQSCGSCHNQKLAFTDNGTRYSKGINGSIGNRNAMPLFNLIWNNGFFWDGGAATLEEQALKPIENPIEMNTTVTSVLNKLNASAKYPTLFLKAFGSSIITKELLAKAISQFERTLVSYNSKFDKVKAGKDTFTASELRGKLIFEDNSPNTGGDCIHCHVIGSTFTDNEFRNNGLDENPIDKGRFLVTGRLADMAKFKVPTLRNIALTAPYMHDGRFTSLQQVVEHYNFNFVNNSLLDPFMQVQAKERLTDQQMLDLVSFLHTLTDSTFINNKEFSNP